MSPGEEVEISSEVRADTDIRISRRQQHSSFVIQTIYYPVRYLVKAKVKPGDGPALLQAIDMETLGKGSIAGDEYLYNMRQARLGPDAIATWVETCFCAAPLDEERAYWEEYFELISVRDAHSRRNCRHENGTERWACCDCDCTAKLEQKLAGQGVSFLDRLRGMAGAAAD